MFNKAFRTMMAGDRRCRTETTEVVKRKVPVTFHFCSRYSANEWGTSSHGWLLWPKIFLWITSGCATRINPNLPQSFLTKWCSTEPFVGRTPVAVPALSVGWTKKTISLQGTLAICWNGALTVSPIKPAGKIYVSGQKIKIGTCYTAIEHGSSSLIGNPQINLKAMRSKWWWNMHWCATVIRQLDAQYFPWNWTTQPDLSHVGCCPFSDCNSFRIWIESVIWHNSLVRTMQRSVFDRITYIGIFGLACQSRRKQIHAPYWKLIRFCSTVQRQL